MDVKFTKKEISWIIIAIIILTFIIGFTTDFNKKTAIINIIPSLISAVLIISTNILTKKIIAPFYNIKIEHKIWQFQRFGFYKKDYLKKPFPIGLVLPFFTTIISFGIVRPLIILEFNAKNLKEKRILKKYGRYRKKEINEVDLAYTSALGFYSLLVLALIGVIIGFPVLTKYSIYYGLWNLIPFGNLDGTKLFFGSLINWTLLTILFIIFLIMIIVL